MQDFWWLDIGKRGLITSSTTDLCIDILINNMQNKKFFHQVFMEKKKKKVCAHVNSAWWHHPHARPLLVVAFPFLRTRPSVPPLELARNWRKVSPSWQPVLLNFPKCRLCLRDGESGVSVFSMHGSALGAVKGEGRSRCCRCRLLGCPLVRQSFQFSPGPTTALPPTEVRKTGGVGLGNFITHQTRREFNRRLC